MQYEWAAGHIKAGLGRLTLERLDRVDVAGWFERLASGGEYSRRSIQIMRPSCAPRSPTQRTRAWCAGTLPLVCRCLAR
jgi:hypothetical protein